MSMQDVMDGKLDSRNKTTLVASLEDGSNINLPLYWKMVRLEEVATYVNGYPFKPSDWETTGLPIIRIQNLNDPTKPYNYFSGQIPERYRVRTGDILISWSASLGTYMWNGTDAWLNQHIFKANVKEDIVYRDYFYWAMTREIEHIAAEQTYGSTMKHVVQKSFLNSQILLPPFSEQHAIAKVLLTVHEAIQARRDELELERERKAALMEYLFTYGTCSEPLKSTDFGELPQSWQIKELGQVADIVYGVQAAVAHALDKSTGIPILTNINIKNDGRLDISLLRYFDLPKSKQEKLLLRKGDLLFNWRSGSQDHVGKTAIFDLEGDYTFSSFILRFRTNKEVNNSFLFYYLHNIKKQGYFAQKRQQSSVNSVFNASVAATIPIVIPSLQEQVVIAEVLSACDVKISALGQEVTLLEELFHALLEELMTGRLSTLPLLEEGYS